MDKTNRNEIFSQRLTAAVLWNIGLQISLAVVLVFLIQVDIIHPISWILSTLQDIYSWKMVLNILLLGLVSFFQAYIYGGYYMAPLPKYFTRFSMFLNMFTIQNLTFSVLYALSGYFTMLLYSSLAKSNFSVLKKSCVHYDGQCLIEQSLFLQFAGMWMGLYYFLNVHVFSTNILIFPHIYQEKFQQIKLTITHIISLGFKKSMLPVLYYCVFYYLWGNKPRRVVSDVYSLYLEDPPLDNIFNLIASGIWIGLWFYTSLFFISVYSMRMIFHIVLTGPMKFPIESETCLTLKDALAQKTQFVGYLGALDLRIMAMTDAQRRQQMFTLSHPGGHPKNWIQILEKSLSIINEFNKDLDEINNNDARSASGESSKYLDKTATRVFYPRQEETLRNMATSPDFHKLKEKKQEETNRHITLLKKEFNEFVQKLCQKPGINYFFGELSDTKLKFLLMQSQPVMWTCEGLAFISAASLTEDKYGIVQNDLPEVITALVNLKQNLDKLVRPGLVPKKHILHDEMAIKMKTALISAVKRSIYKIVITFSKYMHEIPLDHDIQVAIQPFIICREA